MPCGRGKKIRSKAQWRLLWMLATQGKLPKREVRKMVKRTWSSGKRFSELPEHVKKSELLKIALLGGIVRALARVAWKPAKLGLRLLPGVGEFMGKKGIINLLRKGRFPVQNMAMAGFGLAGFTLPLLQETWRAMKNPRGKRAFWTYVGQQAPPPF